MKCPHSFPASLHHILPCGLLLAALLAAVPLDAAVIATDGDVPRGMNAGGTALDPADYIVGETGPFSHSITGGNVFIGYDTSHNRLIVRDGSAVRVSRAMITVGLTEDATHNHLLLTGASQARTGSSLRVGASGAHNQVTIEAGSLFEANSVYVGDDSTATHNRLRVTGAGSGLQVSTQFTVGAGGSDNTVLVEAGGRIDSAALARIGVSGTSSADRNTIHVTGPGSRWSNGGSLRIGEGGGGDNALLVTAAALVDLASLPTFGNGDGNFIGLDGGFLAVQGDAFDLLTGLIDQGRFRHRDADTGDWLVAGLDDLSFDTFADEADALAFSGYAGLAGYTIITAGGMAAVPEPATCAAMAGLASLALAALRRRRR